jgi:hypothetical protein
MLRFRAQEKPMFTRVVTNVTNVTPEIPLGGGRRNPAEPLSSRPTSTLGVGLWTLDFGPPRRRKPFLRFLRFLRHEAAISNWPNIDYQPLTNGTPRKPTPNKVGTRLEQGENKVKTRLKPQQTRQNKVKQGETR